MSSAALHSTCGSREQNTTGGQATSGTRSHRLETGATPDLHRPEAGTTHPRNPSLHHLDDTNARDESSKRDGGEFVTLNDVVAARSFVGLLQANGLDSLDALFGVDGGESLRKSGLGRWRERVRLTVRCDTGQAEEPSPLTLSLGGRGGSEAPSPLTPLPGRERGRREEPRAGACGSFEGPFFDDGCSSEITLYLKRYTEPPRGALRRAIRAARGARSLAGVEWHWLRRLAEDGIPAPRPVAMGEEIVRGREVRSVLVMAAVAGDALERVLAKRDGLDARAIRRLVRPLAELVGKFHRLGYVHRDLYLSHVFFDATGDDESRFSLIDVQRVLRPARPSTSRIVKDLAALNFSAPVGRVTRTERLRWFRWYLEANAVSTSSRAETPLVDKLPVVPARTEEVGGAHPTSTVTTGEVGSAHPTRWARRLDAAGRKLVYRIVGKTLAIRRHQRRREARLAARDGRGRMGSGSP